MDKKIYERIFKNDFSSKAIMKIQMVSELKYKFFFYWFRIF